MLLDPRLPVLEAGEVGVGTIGSIGTSGLVSSRRINSVMGLTMLRIFRSSRGQGSSDSPSRFLLLRLVDARNTSNSRPLHWNACCACLVLCLWILDGVNMHNWDSKGASWSQTEKKKWQACSLFSLSNTAGLSKLPLGPRLLGRSAICVVHDLPCTVRKRWAYRTRLIDSSPEGDQLACVGNRSGSTAIAWHAASMVAHSLSSCMTWSRTSGRATNPCLPSWS